MKKPLWHAIKAVFGILASLATIATWLNIEPKMVGEAAYSALYILTPVLVFGFGALFGYSVKSLMMFRMVRVGKDKRVRLTKAQANVVERMRRGDRFEHPASYDDDILRQLERAGIVERRGSFNIDIPGWRLVDG